MYVHYTCVCVAGSGSVPAGDYLGSGAVLKVRVELMYPLVVEGSSLVVGTRATQRATSLSVSG